MVVVTGAAAEGARQEHGLLGPDRRGRAEGHLGAADECEQADQDDRNSAGIVAVILIFGAGCND